MPDTFFITRILFFHSIHVIVAKSKDFRDVCLDEIVVKDRADYFSLFLPFITLTKNYSMSQATLHISDEHWILWVDVDVVGREKSFHQLRVHQFNHRMIQDIENNHISFGELSLHSIHGISCVLCVNICLVVKGRVEGHKIICLNFVT